MDPRKGVSDDPTSMLKSMIGESELNYKVGILMNLPLFEE